MKSRFNKTLSLTLALALLASIMSPALAAESNTTQTSPVKLTVQPIIFNVVVPSGLPVNVDSKGQVTVATDVQLLNNSAAPITITNVQVNPIPDWNIVPMNADFKNSKIGTKEFGFVLNSDEVPPNGTVSLTKANWPSINGGSNLPLTYDSIVAPQKDTISGNKIADVVFTIGWDINDFALSSESLSIEKGSTSKLNLLGVDSAEWSSSNESVAVVDQTGLITPLDWGTTTVTATAYGISKTCEVTVPKVFNGLTLNTNNVELYETQTQQLTATDKYRSATTWSSNNESVATVSSTGLVTAKSAGTAIITASKSGFSAECSIKVNPIELSNNTLSIEKGNASQLTLPSGLTAIWSSSNESVAAVDQTGKITAIGWGTTTITATIGGIALSCEVTVPKIQTGLELNTNALSLYQLQSSQLTAISKYRAGTVWSSSNPAIATVNTSGLVTGKTAGTTTITATQGGLTATCTATINPITLSSSTLSVEKGSSATLSLTGASVANASWDSSNESIATVDQTGKVTAIGWGTSTITATIGGIVLSCEVTVPKIQNGLELNTNTLSLYQLQTSQLTATSKYRAGTVWISSNPTVATVSTSGLVTGKTTGTTIITATQGSFADSCTVTIKPITLSSSTLSVEKGFNTTLSLIGASGATWASSTPSIATVDQTGKISAVDWGTTTITATIGGIVLSCEVTVPKIQNGLELNTNTLSLYQLQTSQLTATSKYRAGTVWTSSNPAIATVSASGLITAKTAGTTTITATQGAFTDSCTVTVKPITLSSSSLSVEKGSAATLNLTGAAVANATWTSSTPSVATVDQTGKITAIGWGTTTVTATIGGIVLSCEVTVPKIQNGLELNTNALSLYQLQTSQLTATSKYRAGTVWTSSNPVIATVGTSGLVTGKTAGTTTITATQGSFSDSCTVTIKPITLSSSTLSVEKGSNATLSLTGASGATWTSSTPSVATVDQTGKITAIGWGTTTVTATIGGIVLSCEVTVPKIQNGLELNTNVLSLYQLQTSQLTATSKYRAGTVWTSSNPAIATVSASGLVTGKTAGTTTITATQGAFTDSCTVTVKPITLSSSTLSVEKGSAATLNLTGAAVANATWASSAPSVATVDQTGKITALDWGTTTVTATIGGIVLSCEVTVPKIQTGLEMNVVSQTLGIGKTFQLIATSKYRAGTVWTSSNPAVATVNTSGLVTAKTPGTTTITATQGAFTATCNLTSVLEIGTKYTQGNYEYSYGQSYMAGWAKSGYNGWGVRIIDDTQTSYVQPLEEIYGKPVVSYHSLFYNYPNTSLTLEGTWTNKNVWDMGHMFNHSRATSLDLSRFNTPNVTNMMYMFYESSANTLDLSGFNTSKVRDMPYMFQRSKALEIKGLSNFNTSNVTDMSYMFAESQATELDLSNWDTLSVLRMSYMFANSKANSLDLSNWNSQQVTDMSYMFYKSSATSLDLSGLNFISFTTSSVTDMTSMFEGSKATTLDLSSFNTYNVTNMNRMFYGSQATTILDLNTFYTSNVTDMSYMFAESQATELDLSSFDTSNVTNMSRMFYNSGATSLNLSSFDTSKITDMSNMFYGSQATTLNLSSFDTSNVTNMGSMFANSQATTLNLSSFDTSKVENMVSMFANSQATTLDLSSFDTSNVRQITMSSMFMDSYVVTGYARTQADANKFNASYGKPSALTFVMKPV